MKRARGVTLVGIGLALLLAIGACGGDKGQPVASPIPSATVPATAGPASATPVFPPTWTPVPTRTEPPRVTIDYTYVAPTAPTFVLPTYTPTPITPTVAPPGPTLMIALGALNDAIVESAEMYYIRARVDTLAAAIDGDALVLNGTRLIAPEDDPTAMRPFTLKATVAVNEGRIRLNLTSAAYTDEAGGALDIEQANAILAEVESTLADLLITAYEDTGGQKFYLSDLYVSPDGFSCVTVSLD